MLFATRCSRPCGASHERGAAQSRQPVQRFDVCLIVRAERSMT